MWDANVIFKSCSIDGYVYNGVWYSKSELMNDFGFNLNLTSVMLKSVVITFNNGKSFNSRYLEEGGVGTHQDLSYSENDEKSDFNLRSISIPDGIRDSNIESKIKRELFRKEQKRKNEEYKKKEEERIKKLEEEEERLAEIKREEEIAKQEEERLAELEREEEIAKQEEAEREKEEREEAEFEKSLEEAREQAEKEAAIKKKNAKEEREMIKEYNEKMIEADSKLVARERVDRTTYNSVETIDNASKAMNDYLDNAFNAMNQTNYSYNNYRRNVESATRITSSKDPYVIISQYNSKITELERIHYQRLNQRIREIENYASQQRASSNSEMEKLGVEIGAMIVKGGLQREISEAKAKAKKQLDKQKEELLTDIKVDIIRDFRKRKASFLKRAAVEINVDKENYYLEMAKHFQCKIEKAESLFSIDNTEWVDPYCKEVKRDYSDSKDDPTAQDLFEASKRKAKNPDILFQKASKDLIDMAIETNPNNASFYYHRSQFEKLSSPSVVYYLNKTIELDPEFQLAKESILLAEAEREKESSFYLAYIEKYPRGKFIKHAKEKYNHYLNQEKQNSIYHDKILRLNSLIDKDKMGEAKALYIVLKENQFFSQDDIRGYEKVEQYLAYLKAKEINSFFIMEDFVRSYPSGKYSEEFQHILNENYIDVADQLFKDDNYNGAVQYYDKYLIHVPEGPKHKYAINQKAKALKRQYRVDNQRLVTPLTFYYDENSYGIGGSGFRNFGLGYYLKFKGNSFNILDKYEIESFALPEGVNSLETDSNGGLVDKIRYTKVLEESVVDNLIAIYGRTLRLFNPLWMNAGVGVGLFATYNPVIVERYEWNSTSRGYYEWNYLETNYALQDEKFEFVYEVGLNLLLFQGRIHLNYGFTGSSMGIYQYFGLGFKI